MLFLLIIYFLNSLSLQVLLNMSSIFITITEIQVALNYVYASMIILQSVGSRLFVLSGFRLARHYT